MTWTVKRTDTFLESLRYIRKNKEALAELDKKLKRLREDREDIEKRFSIASTGSIPGSKYCKDE